MKFETKIAFCTIQTAILGFITENMRSITFGINLNKIIIRFVYDGVCTDDDVENCSCIETEVIASYYSKYIISTDIISIDYPESYNDSLLDEWIYIKKEDNYINLIEKYLVNNDIDVHEIKICAQRSTFGLITTNVRFISFEFNEFNVKLMFIYDGFIGSEDIINCNIIKNNLNKLLGVNYSVDYDVISINLPENRKKYTLKYCIYARNEYEYE
jgi:hypothetical protein